MSLSPADVITLAGIGVNAGLLLRAAYKLGRIEQALEGLVRRLELLEEENQELRRNPSGPNMSRFKTV